jgi:rhamnose utilization protein RhaD (predicted bifunctional aldolase and dehydrogenase)
MKSLFDENIAKDIKTDLDMRVYTSRLLGQDSSLVLHGGGNTSVKSKVDGEDILYVKGSGWDLATIEAEGFAPVRLDALIGMAKLESLSDTDMVSQQREAMIDTKAPNPSIEAILHAIIPFKYVDHTHSDAVVTISNTIDGTNKIEQIYKDFLIVPYVMPGFILAKTIYDMSKDLDWSKCKGIILLNHGIFTFSDDAKIAYEDMIDAVSLAEDYLQKHALIEMDSYDSIEMSYSNLASIISEYKGYDVVVKINESNISKEFAQRDNIDELCKKGILTPEHIIRTKRYPMLVDSSDLKGAIDKYISEYTEYFKTYAKDEIMLNPAPNWAVIKGIGTLSFGKNEKEATIIDDITTHTMEAILRGEAISSYECISEKDGFDMEYWELEQAKLRKK